MNQPFGFLTRLFLWHQAVRGQQLREKNGVGPTMRLGDVSGGGVLGCAIRRFNGGMIRRVWRKLKPTKGDAFGVFAT